MMKSEEINSLSIGDDAKGMLLFLMAENQRLQAKIDNLETQMISTEEACKLLGCARNKFWKMSKQDNFPKAVQMGKSNHYKRSEILTLRDKKELTH